jgi:PAS domain S-box-containing protein
MRDIQANEDEAPLCIKVPATTKTSETLLEIDSIGITELLDHDSRPTFLLDLDTYSAAKVDPSILVPIFCNSALRTYEVLVEVVSGRAPVHALGFPDTVPYEDFRSWALSISQFDESRDVFPQSFLFCGKLWTGSTVRKRWRFISGNHCYETSSAVSAPLSSSSGSLCEKRTASLKRKQAFDGTTVSLGQGPDPSVAAEVFSQVGFSSQSPRSPREPSEGTFASKNIASSPKHRRTITNIQNISTSSLSLASSRSIILGTPPMACPDWTKPKITGILSEHVQFARDFDWGTTPLRSMNQWSPEFRQIANLLMSNPHPAALFWGEELTMMYNEAYRDIVAGHKHPALLGSGFTGPFREVWDSVRDVFNEAALTGKSGSMIDQMLPIERYSFLEETYFSWSFTPLYGGGDKILGFYNAPFETTRQNINSRRTETLRRLGEEVALARTVKEFWGKVLAGLETNHYDIPFALLYSVAEVDDGDSSSHSSNASSISLKSCIFEGGLGVPAGHVAAPSRLDLKRSREGFVPSFREAMRTREPTKLQTADGSLPEWLIEDIEWRGFGEPCREAVIFPVRPTTGDNVLAFLMIGINPRRPYDDDYKSFANMLNRQLATSLASIILFEEEIRRGATAAEAATLERERLSEQLAVQTYRLQRMVEHSPVGMFYINPEGSVLEANDRWYDMTGLAREESRNLAWMKMVTDDNRELIREGWRRLSVDGMSWSSEIRLKKPWVDSITGQTLPSVILAAGHPEFNPDGSIRSVMGTLTDISQIKWAEGLQERRLKEAEEARRQQENFIDMTSHEMRNPLSAIFHCADDIATALGEYRSSTVAKTALPTKMVEDCIEAAETIALCAQHQKSIVDDILTVSKLDSDLLVITPAVVQPVAIAHRAIKMFDAEFSKKSIDIQFSVQQSFEELQIDRVVLDPSRLLQILINLVTNAIKFTQSQAIRSVHVRLAASLQPSFLVEDPDFEYIPRKNIRSKLKGPDWGAGELIYLQFEVQDTGQGLTPAEKKLLFLRFSQVSPRTHAQYGGSGLGLFISRNLTELHGGQIGVGSETGRGSTFAFYIAARRAVAQTGGRGPVVALDPWGPNGPIDNLATQAKEQLSLQDVISGSTAAQETTLDLKQFSVLIVEDNLVNQRVLSKQLQRLGCKIQVASHGGEALDYLQTTEIWKGNEGNSTAKKLTIILMDLEMPVMDGLTCVRRVREMEAEGAITVRLPIIAITANVRLEQVDAAKRAGMVRLRRSPISMD